LDKDIHMKASRKEMLELADRIASQELPSDCLYDDGVFDLIVAALRSQGGQADVRQDGNADEPSVRDTALALMIERFAGEVERCEHGDLLINIANSIREFASTIKAKSRGPSDWHDGYEEGLRDGEKIARELSPLASQAPSEASSGVERKALERIARYPFDDPPSREDVVIIRELATTALASPPPSASQAKESSE
jgi:hypothetical protein